jgi:hypothetical protein
MFQKIMTLNDNDTKVEFNMKAKDIIFQKMMEIASDERRSFSFKDFISFEIGGNEFSYRHGTIRNVFSWLRSENKIELVCKSPQAFYTVKGIDVGVSMTGNYRGGIRLNPRQQKFLDVFRIRNLDTPAIHDIRLIFEYKGLKDILLKNNNTNFIKNIDELANKDITLQDIEYDKLVIKTTVHNTDRISVMIACSENPIPFTAFGLAKLSSALTRVETRLQDEIENYEKASNEFKPDQKGLPSIPNHMSWILTLWHFGGDSFLNYTGETFDITWNEMFDVYHIYSKTLKKKMVKSQR